SSAVSPEFREYERTITTVVNAYLRPVCRPYLERLEDFADEVLVMTSAGGLIGSGDAARLPAALLLSGPAGGVRAGSAVAAACGYADAVTFDMGGTGTDVCLVRGGVPEQAPRRGRRCSMRWVPIGRHRPLSRLREWWRWSMPPWSRRCGPSPWSGGWTRPGWRWSPSAGRGRCTPVRWPRPSTCRP